MKAVERLVSWRACASAAAPSAALALDKNKTRRARMHCNDTLHIKRNINSAPHARAARSLKEKRAATTAATEPEKSLREKEEQGECTT